MYMKKIVIFGGGSGLSQLLKGLKLFPIQITAVVSVADNGSSTGKLREELNIPAVGDITKVILSMSDIDNDIIDLLNYRFVKSKTLGGHSIKNLLLTALLEQKGSFAEAVPVMSKLLNMKGNILPLTEDSVNLVGYTKCGKKIFGEEQLTKCSEEIIRVGYDKNFTVNSKIYDAIDEADLIVFSSGSLNTSLIPHLIDKKLNKYILNSNKEKLYVCNLFTQPGETDDFTVSDHINLINKYFKKDVIDIIVANNNIMSNELSKTYLTKEQKEFVLIDYENLEKLKAKMLTDDLVTIEDGFFRHNSLKTAYLIFRYLMEGK